MEPHTTPTYCAQDLHMLISPHRWYTHNPSAMLPQSMASPKPQRHEWGKREICGKSPPRKNVFFAALQHGCRRLGVWPRMSPMLGCWPLGIRAPPRQSAQSARRSTAWSCRPGPEALFRLPGDPGSTKGLGPGNEPNFGQRHTTYLHRKRD